MRVAIRSPITRAMLHYVRSRGVDVESIMDGAGVPAKAMTNPDEPFVFDALEATWREASAALEDPLLGLHVGQALELSALGVVGYLLQSSDTLGDAFGAASRYTTLTGGIIDLSTRRGQTRWTIVFALQPSVPGPEASLVVRHITDAGMAIAVKALRVLGQRDVVPRRVSCTYPSIAEVGEDRRALGVDPCFSGDEALIDFDSHVCDLPVAYGDPALHALFEKRAQAMLERARRRADVAAKVTTWITQHLRSPDLSLSHAARKLFMSPRTLQRKLEREGTSFHALLEDVRRELAEDYLGRLGMSVADAAFLLGFSEPSAFTRSFKRWLGVSPREYRVRHDRTSRQETVVIPR